MIEWSRRHSLTAREIAAALARDGFAMSHQKGSHQRYRHLDGRRVTLTFHRPGDTFPPKTLPPENLGSMIEDQARWSADDLRRLELLG